MSTAQLAAVSYLARYSGRTHTLYAYQLKQWFAWCEGSALDPLVGIQRAHVELYIRQLGDGGLMDSSVVTMLHAVRGYFRFAHIDGLIAADPAVYARLPKIHTDESRTHGLDRLELIRFLQIAQTLTVHHGALAYLLGINALRASEAAAVRIEDYADTLRGHRVLHLVGKGNKPATMPLTFPVLRVLEACRGQRTCGPLVLRPVSGKPIERRDAYRMVTRIAKVASIPRHISPHSLAARRDHQCLGRRRPPAGRSDPGPARRPLHHRALRPRPRQPRPTRRPLPHRIRRRCLKSRPTSGASVQFGLGPRQLALSRRAQSATCAVRTFRPIRAPEFSVAMDTGVN
ncbi:MAG: tyrosine-type recombinase/integrase [Ornithinimicrobium sp.]|uniref:tyrosine-type recombinase/integrase n=1 Tax=Ornithinimicrobium sp. TaxID=1977084 RepID=UPI003D9B7C5E